MSRPEEHDSAETVAARIVERVGRRIVLALPLGLGKADRVANALFQRAKADPSISLTIFTALTLEKPGWSSDLERRFVEPLAARLYPNYVGLDYARALRQRTLPPNVHVNEFFFLAGQWLGVDEAQQHYVSANYTHAARYVLDRGVNVIAQFVAKRGEGETARYSLSSNTDITLDILPSLKQRAEPCLMVGQVSSQLPYMTGEAELPAGEFDMVLEGPGRDDALFVAPRPPVSDADHAIGLHAAGLVKDGGTLQIGIGSLGDGLTAGLVLRHRRPDLFAEALGRLAPDGAPEDFQGGRFETGLYAASEMLVDGFMDLYREGILKRRAADGAMAHCGFFVGSRALQEFLRELGEDERALFSMRGISFVNELYGGEADKRADRLHARFVNSAMMTTLLGATISDTLDNGRVVSGVGGQYNFVAQAFALEGARSIITLNATRLKDGRRRSRIVWNYGLETVPRHLRDIVVTEYGVADLRGRTDRDCVAAMLAITDAAFQEELLDTAKSAGKIEKSYEIPREHRKNVPGRISEALSGLRAEGWCRTFPFGSDFTADEQALLPALEKLKGASGSLRTLMPFAAGALAERHSTAREAELLSRMELGAPRTLKERVYARLLLHALRRSAR